MRVPRQGGGQGPLWPFRESQTSVYRELTARVASVTVIAAICGCEDGP